MSLEELSRTLIGLGQRVEVKEISSDALENTCNIPYVMFMCTCLWVHGVTRSFEEP